MKRTNSKTDFTKGSILAAALFSLGVGFTLPAQATDGEEVSITVAAVEQDVSFTAEQADTTRTSSQSDNTEATTDAQRGAFANEPQWRRRVFESH